MIYFDCNVVIKQRTALPGATEVNSMRMYQEIVSKKAAIDTPTTRWGKNTAAGGPQVVNDLTP